MNKDLSEGSKNLTRVNSKAHRYNEKAMRERRAKENKQIIG